jgi:uncharacterized protein
MGSKLLPDAVLSAYSFTGYGDSHVEINRQVWKHSVIVQSHLGPIAWEPSTSADICADHLQAIAESDAEVLIIGTGSRQVFLPRDTLQVLHARKGPHGVPRGIEVMSTPAACRTFNLLAAEGRRVLAAVLIASQPQLEQST